MFVKRYFILILLSTTFASLYGQGIQDSVFKIKTVQVRANRLFNKDNAGMTETKIDSMVLKTNVALSLSEVLSEHSSVFIKSHGRGALASASFRGTAASHTQVNWNGVNINSPMTGMVDFSLIPMYLIDELNLQHGNASIASNSGGIGGSINLNNKPDWNNRLSIKYTQGVASFKTFDELFHFKIGRKKWQSVTRLYHSYSKNDYTFINKMNVNIDPKTKQLTHPLDTNKNADYKKYGWLQEFYLKSSPNDIVSLKLWLQKANRSIPRPVSNESTKQSNINKQTLMDFKSVLDWKHYREHNDWHFKSAWIYSDMLFTVKNLIQGVGMQATIYSKNKQKSSLNQITYRHFFSKSFSLEASVSLNFHSVSSSDTIKKWGYSHQRAEYNTFLSLKKQWFKRLNLNLMLRKEWEKEHSLPIIPFLGLDYALLKDKSWVLKGNISKNYHRPTLNDLYWQPGGNSELKPEDGYSYELGLEYQKGWNHFNLGSGINAYRSDINNWIVWLRNFKGLWTPLNIKKVLVKGLEGHLKLTSHWGKWRIKLSGTYAYTRSLNYGDPLVWGDNSHGKQLVYVPVHSGNMSVEVSYAHFHCSYMFNSFSERFTTTSNQRTRRNRLYPYFMNDMSFEYKTNIKKYALAVRFSIYNLFNEDYHTILYRPMPRINYALLVSFGF